MFRNCRHGQFLTIGNVYVNIRCISALKIQVYKLLETRRIVISKILTQSPLCSNNKNNKKPNTAGTEENSRANEEPVDSVFSGVCIG